MGETFGSGLFANHWVASAVLPLMAAGQRVAEEHLKGVLTFLPDCWEVFFLSIHSQVSRGVCCGATD